MLRSFAPAKVNLHLHVTGRRADGYHLLDSLVVFPAVGDWLEVRQAPELSLAVDGPFGAALAADPDNLVLRAARLVKPGAGAALRLTKNLPVASGIGGGSADAAAALRALARLWDVPGSAHEPAARLGADVPVCLARTPALMAGIGEVLSPAPKLPAFGIILVNPGVAVATPAVSGRGGEISLSRRRCRLAGRTRRRWRAIWRCCATTWRRRRSDSSRSSRRCWRRSKNCPACCWRG